jgi:hypothetical protein
MLVGSLAEAKECKLGSGGCDARSLVANGPVVVRLGEDLYATALEKHVNEVVYQSRREGVYSSTC